MRKIFMTLWVLGVISCGEKKYHDQKLAPIAEVSDSLVKAAMKYQLNLDQAFMDAAETPLLEKDRVDFDGLDYFPINPALIVNAQLNRTPQTLPFMMPTTTERMTEERVYGQLTFSLDGQVYQLPVYQSSELMKTDEYSDYLFLPFTDLTNGEETYIGGRYLDLRIPQGDEITLDFNRAYNPYCAYNKKYSCPIVPPANHLPLRINAGVKAFKAMP
jgi:uncharacterized protein (DUF1684 family)